jgi:hypothetical protein
VQKAPRNSGRLPPIVMTSPTNSEKPIKAVICHLPPDTPTEDISNSLEGLGFSVISVRQMTADHRS